MVNYMKKINIPTSEPSKPEPLMHPEGEDWEVIDQVTGNLPLQPGRANAVICPDTGNAQDNQHLIKDPKKLKWSKGMSNETGNFSKGSGTYRELPLVFKSTGTKFPKTPRSHIAALSETFGPRRKGRTECDLLWEEID